jgi:hypothetical protein
MGLRDIKSILIKLVGGSYPDDKLINLFKGSQVNYGSRGGLIPFQIKEMTSEGDWYVFSGAWGGSDGYLARIPKGLANALVTKWKPVTWRNPKSDTMLNAGGGIVEMSPTKSLYNKAVQLDWDTLL